jgi:anti-anti-sigma factor
VTFDVRRRLTSTMTVLELSGEVDLLTAPRLGMAIDDKVRAGRNDLVVDLHDADFIDSVGLHILLNASRRLTRQGRGLVVVCPQGPVRRVLELSRLIETLNVVSHLSERQPAPSRRRRVARSARAARRPATVTS